MEFLDPGLKTLSDPAVSALPAWAVLILSSGSAGCSHVVWEVRKELELQLVEKVDVSTCFLLGKGRVCEHVGFQEQREQQKDKDNQGSRGQRIPLGEDVEAERRLMRLEQGDRKCDIVTYNKKHIWPSTCS